MIRAGGVLRGRGRASWLGPSGGFPAQLRGGLAARPTARGSDRRCAPRSLRPGRGAETALLGAAPSPRGDARERSVTAASEGAVGAQQRRRPSSVASPQPLGRGAWRPSWQSPAPRLVCSGRCRAAPPGTAVRGGAAGNRGAPDPGRTDGDAGAEKRVLASPARRWRCGRDAGPPRTGLAGQSGVYLVSSQPVLIIEAKCLGKCLQLLHEARKDLRQRHWGAGERLGLRSGGSDTRASPGALPPPASLPRHLLSQEGDPPGELAKRAALPVSAPQ